MMVLSLRTGAVPFNWVVDVRLVSAHNYQDRTGQLVCGAVPSKGDGGRHINILIDLMQAQAETKMSRSWARSCLQARGCK